MKLAKIDFNKEESEMMQMMKAERKEILVPVFGSVDAAEIARISFWLARDAPSHLDIVEIKAPPTFFGWLVSPIANLFRSDQSARLRRILGKAFSQGLDCDASEQKAPSLLLGIVEAARRVNPDTVALALEIRARLGAGGIDELKRRLSEIGTFALFLAGRGAAMRFEPCYKKDAFEQGRVASIKKTIWTA